MPKSMLGTVIGNGKNQWHSPPKVSLASGDALVHQDLHLSPTILGPTSRSLI
jgi:hypothetical protein